MGKSLGDAVNIKDGRWTHYGHGDGDDWMDENETYENCTSLHYAARWGLTRICSLLLDSPNFMEANARCRIPAYMNTDYAMVAKDGCTALHCATVRGSLSVV